MLTFDWVKLTIKIVKISRNRSWASYHSTYAFYFPARFVEKLLSAIHSHESIEPHYLYYHLIIAATADLYYIIAAKHQLRNDG